MLLALHHLDSFAVIESWSGYFHPTAPAGDAPLDLGSARANRQASAHSVVPMLRRAFQRRPTFFAFYVARFRAEKRQAWRKGISGAAGGTETTPGPHRSAPVPE